MPSEKDTIQRYEGCSNMNASSFITFGIYALRQNGIRFYKGLYITLKLAPDLKKKTVYLSIYGPLNEGYSILEDFENGSPYFCSLLANRIMRLKGYLQVLVCSPDLV